MALIELREDEVGVYDQAAVKALLARTRGMSYVPARIRLGLQRYSTPIGPKWRDVIFLEAIERTKTTFERIRDSVCSREGITIQQFNGDRKTQDIVKVRREVWYLVSQQTNLSLPKIGRLSGGKDHTTILHGIRSYEQEHFGRPYPRGDRNRERALERHREKYAHKRRSAAALVEG